MVRALAEKQGIKRHAGSPRRPAAARQLFGINRFFCVFLDNHMIFVVKSA
jgi:hypothetical protein